jgi:LRR receptor-like serine/threonine-protein kinase FLS2
MERVATRKGDVYSFGIVLIETFTKKKPTDAMFVGEMSLKRWVADSLLSDAIVEVVDGNLLGKEEDHDFVNKRDCLSSIMKLSLACSAESVEERISMQDAADTLHKIKNNFLKDVGGV